MSPSAFRQYLAWRCWLSTFTRDLVASVTPLEASDCIRSILTAPRQPPNVDMFEIALWPATLVR